jgi:hypothetical protein
VEDTQLTEEVSWGARRSRGGLPRDTTHRRPVEVSLAAAGEEVSMRSAVSPAAACSLQPHRGLDAVGGLASCSLQPAAASRP